MFSVMFKIAWSMCPFTLLSSAVICSFDRYGKISLTMKICYKNALTSVYCLIDRYHWTSRCSCLTLKPNSDIWQPSSRSKIEKVPPAWLVVTHRLRRLWVGSIQRVVMAVEFTSTNWAVFTSTFNKLHNAEPVKRVVAW